MGKVLKLDLLSIYPYLTLKNIFLLIGFSFFYSVIFKKPELVFLISQIFVVKFSVYPFILKERTGVDSLYRVYGISPKKVVSGRYLYGMVLSVLGIVLGVLLFVGASLSIYQEVYWESITIAVPVSFVIAFLFILLQYPIQFRYGYEKARIVWDCMTLMIMGAGYLLIKGKKQGAFPVLIAFGDTGPWLFVGSIFLMMAAFAIVSIGISMKVYQEKEME